MRINTITALVAAAALAGSVTALSAQAPGRGGRAGGRGGRGNLNYGSTQAPTSPVTGNATAGKQLYYQYACYSCHGYTGETGARPFVNHWTANLATEASFITFLRGRADAHPARPSTSMPNFAANTVSDAKLKDIYAYIRSFTSHTPAATPAALAEILKSANKPYKK
jgi:mono/diheme cytochrome c family protein